MHCFHYSILAARFFLSPSVVHSLAYLTILISPLFESNFFGNDNVWGFSLPIFAIITGHSDAILFFGFPSSGCRFPTWIGSYLGVDSAPISLCEKMTTPTYSHAIAIHAMHESAKQQTKYTLRTFVLFLKSLQRTRVRQGTFQQL